MCMCVYVCSGLLIEGYKSISRNSIAGNNTIGSHEGWSGKWAITRNKGASPPPLSHSLLHLSPSGVEAVLCCLDPHSGINDLFPQLLELLPEDGSLPSALFEDCLG